MSSGATAPFAPHLTRHWAQPRVRLQTRDCTRKLLRIVYFKYPGNSTRLLKNADKTRLKPTAKCRHDGRLSKTVEIFSSLSFFDSKRGGFVLHFARPVKTVRPFRRTLLENFTITYSTVDARTTVRKTSKLYDAPVDFAWNSRYFTIITKPIWDTIFYTRANVHDVFVEP